MKKILVNGNETDPYFFLGKIVFGIDLINKNIKAVLGNSLNSQYSDIDCLYDFNDMYRCLMEVKDEPKRRWVQSILKTHMIFDFPNLNENDAYILLDDLQMVDFFQILKNVGFFKEQTTNNVAMWIEKEESESILPERVLIKSWGLDEVPRYYSFDAKKNSLRDINTLVVDSEQFIHALKRMGYRLDIDLYEEQTRWYF